MLNFLLILFPQIKLDESNMYFLRASVFFCNTDILLYFSELILFLYFPFSLNLVSILVILLFAINFLTGLNLLIFLLDFSFSLFNFGYFSSSN